MGHAVVVANPHPVRDFARTTGQLAQTDTPDPLLQNVPGVGPVLTRVGRHWLVLAIATLLAVAYGTRREDAEARHLNLPAPAARDPHRTPPSLSPHPGRLGPQHHAARHTRTSAHTGPFYPHTAGDSRPRRAWPSPPIPNQEIPLSSPIPRRARQQ